MTTEDHQLLAAKACQEVEYRMAQICDSLEYVEENVDGNDSLLGVIGLLLVGMNKVIGDFEEYKKLVHPSFGRPKQATLQDPLP